MRIKTHRYALDYALNVLFKKKKNQKFIGEILENKKDLLRGNLNEDYLCLKKRVLEIKMLGLSHFYNPRIKKSFLFDIFGNGKVIGAKRFNKAKKYYLKGDIKNAYYNLGRAIHILHDLAAPVHVHLLPHGILDRCENYLNKNCDKMRLPEIKIVHFENIGDYYHNIALKVFPFEVENRFNVRWQLKRLLGEEKISNEELKRQANTIVPLMVSYTAGLIEHFLKDVGR